MFFFTSPFFALIKISLLIYSHLIADADFQKAPEDFTNGYRGFGCSEHRGWA
jgi:hypothetical protein